MQTWNNLSFTFHPNTTTASNSKLDKPKVFPDPLSSDSKPNHLGFPDGDGSPSQPLAASALVNATKLGFEQCLRPFSLSFPQHNPTSHLRVGG